MWSNVISHNCFISHILSITCTQKFYSTRLVFFSHPAHVELVCLADSQFDYYTQREKKLRFEILFYNIVDMATETHTIETLGLQTSIKH